MVVNGILTEFAASILVKQLVYAAKAMNPIIDSVQTKNEDVKVNLFERTVCSSNDCDRNALMIAIRT